MQSFTAAAYLARLRVGPCSSASAITSRPSLSPNSSTDDYLEPIRNLLSHDAYSPKDTSEL